MNDCKHENFGAHCDVSRITREDGGDLYTFNVSVRVHCIGCGAELSFEGLPRGINLNEPVCNPFGTEARLPAHIFRESDKDFGTYTVVVPEVPHAD